MHFLRNGRPTAAERLQQPYTHRHHPPAEGDRSSRVAPVYAWKGQADGKVDREGPSVSEEGAEQIEQ